MRCYVVGVVLTVALASAAVGCGGGGDARVRDTTGSPAQALRTCVDRWNQGNMVDWGPALVGVSVRQLDAQQLAQVGMRDRALRRCVARFAFVLRRDPRTGCVDSAPLPGRPGLCVDRGTFFCVMNRFGGYNCPLRHEPDRRRPLRSPNAKTDKHGVLTLDVPLSGTRATPPLVWQRRYPHTDGWIEPWTRSGTLRPGLKLTAGYRGGGYCDVGSEESPAKFAVRCVWRGIFQVDPCFPQRADWRHRGALVACPADPGTTTFGRFVISRRS
jgi:hypothetical protein